MERIWRLLVAVFILCAAIALALLMYLFQDTVIAGIAGYGVLFLLPIGLIKGFYNIFFYHPDDGEKTE